MQPIPFILATGSQATNSARTASRAAVKVNKWTTKTTSALWSTSENGECQYRAWPVLDRDRQRAMITPATTMPELDTQVASLGSTGSSMTALAMKPSKKPLARATLCTCVLSNGRTRQWAENDWTLKQSRIGQQWQLFALFENKKTTITDLITLIRN